MLKNTIITNITSPEQHKRVQEKLFGMGHTKLQFGKNEDHIYIDCRGILSYWGGNKFDEAIKKCTETYGRPEPIPASEFLGEDLTNTKVEGSTGTSFFYGRSLPEKDEVEECPKTATEIFMKSRQMGRHWFTQEYINQFNKYNPSTSHREGKGTKIMENIVSFFNDLTVSQEDKELRKAGLLTSDLLLSDEAFDIIKDLESKERGYKNFEELLKFVSGDDGSDGRLSAFEGETLYKKFYPKLLETAKKFNRKDEKKAK